MKLVEATSEDMQFARRMNRSKWSDLINEFLKSDMDVAEVKDFDCQPVAAIHGITYIAKRRNLPVRASTRKGRIFIIRDHDNE